MGLELLRLADGLADEELHDALRFAIDLLSERQVDEVVRLLDEGDEYTAREAAARLRAMKSPRAAGHSGEHGVLGVWSRVAEPPGLVRPTPGPGHL